MISHMPHRLDRLTAQPARTVHLPGDVQFTRMETVHVCLIALFEEMRTRYRTREYETPSDDELPVVVVIEDIPELCRQLERLWRQISTALHQARSPAVNALTQLHSHGHQVGLHIQTPANALHSIAAASGEVSSIDAGRRLGRQRVPRRGGRRTG